MQPRRRQLISQGDRSNSGIPRPTPGVEVSGGTATCSPPIPKIILQNRGSKGRPSERLRRIKYACGDNIRFRRSYKIFARTRTNLPPFPELLPGCDQLLHRPRLGSAQVRSGKRSVRFVRSLGAPSCPTVRACSAVLPGLCGRRSRGQMAGGGP